MAQQHVRYRTLTLQASLEELVRLGEDSLLVCLEGGPLADAASPAPPARRRLPRRKRPAAG